MSAPSASTAAPSASSSSHPHPPPLSTTASHASSSASPGADHMSVASTGVTGGGASTARAKEYVPIKTGDPQAKRSAKACQYCRKGKARCNGLEEYPCRRCRENGVECVFEGMSTEELKARAERQQEEKRKANGGLADPVLAFSLLESRLNRLETELNGLRSRSDTHEGRLDQLDARAVAGAVEGGTTAAVAAVEVTPPIPAPVLRRTPSTPYEPLEREAFDLFWEMYAPLAPYIDSAQDSYDQLQARSPLLLACIVAVASRLNENAEFVAYYRARALQLLRETLYPERTLTIDDLKATLVYNAWLGKGLPPGNAISIALQLDLPRALERLLASLTAPPEEANLAFEKHMPAVRTYLALYSMDLWLSFAMGRRSLVTIDLSITSARLLLNFPSLRPVDGRLVAQAELTTILGVVQESFLKTERQAAQTLHLIAQANSHMELWVQTWRGYAESQDPATARYILASFSVLLQGGRFYTNCLLLKDITTAEEALQPERLMCLRTALDAAVRMQAIHPAQKIAHSAEFTYITLSTAALFLLKMIKLAPQAFSPLHCPAYPSFSTLSATTPTNLPYDATASSPDTSASPLSLSVPSVSQALDATRHCAKLLAHAPARQRSYAQAVEAALAKLESELASVQVPPVPMPLINGAVAGVPTVLGKRPHDGGGANGTAEKRPTPAAAQAVMSVPPPIPAPSAGAAPSATVPSLFHTPLAAHASLAPDPLAFRTPSAGGLNPAAPTPAAAAPTPDFGLWHAAGDFSLDASGGGMGAAGGGGEGGADVLDELTIASLVGSDSFWSWSASLPGESIQPFIS
ncbi:hypothetical protein JCM8097_000649 [Rhodosporidiobolus ruineniae]